MQMAQAVPPNYQEQLQELAAVESVASTTVIDRDDQSVTEPAWSLPFQPSETSRVPVASTALARNTVKRIHVSPRIEEPSSTYRAPLAKLNATWWQLLRPQCQYSCHLWSRRTAMQAIVHSMEDKCSSGRGRWQDGCFMPTGAKSGNISVHARLFCTQLS